MSSRTTPALCFLLSLTISFAAYALTTHIAGEGIATAISKTPNVAETLFWAATGANAGLLASLSIADRTLGKGRETGDTIITLTGATLLMSAGLLGYLAARTSI